MQIFHSEKIALPPAAQAILLLLFSAVPGILLANCSSAPQATTPCPISTNNSEIAFPRQVDQELLLEGELVGHLMIQDGCLVVRSLYDDQFYLPLWPPGYVLEEGREEVHLADDTGEPAVLVGEEIYLSGGQVSEAPLQPCLQQQIPAHCPGPYWLVGNTIRSNLQPKGDYTQLVIINDGAETAILPLAASALFERAQETQAIQGRLTHSPIRRCPRIESESGLVDYLPLWPSGTSAKFEGGLLQIENPAGETAGVEGQPLVLRGSPLPFSLDAELYRTLHSQLPGDCPGPYWLVLKDGP